ncbi:fibroblast growth factor [Apocheima cinerarium nucleopolyhedrovirus]|uniref:fibroblast growth factor n=1 Tax=Apocheima cinerarium nucleopolyhedrovirus TaxID=307461 RepID=UPI0001D92047|nr:fibroblast growth factor [Apocheima cinerarium nucleopolyhedrovirus]ADB84379.1 fibroblast growth factor [Apocheima cinerarium nucleopolyhedrovirus]
MHYSLNAEEYNIVIYTSNKMFSTVLILFVTSIFSTVYSIPLNSDTSELDAITGTSKHIKIYMGNKWLTGHSDGIINGTSDGTSADNIDHGLVWHRFAHNLNILLRNAEYCYYLCINDCGHVYSATVPNKQCLLTEEMSGGYTYFQRKMPKQSMYVAINIGNKMRNSIKFEGEPMTFANKASSILTRISDYKSPSEECAPLNKSKLNYKPKNKCAITARKIDPKIMSNEIPNPESADSVDTIGTIYTTITGYEINKINNETAEIDKKNETDINETVLGSVDENLYSVDTEPIVEVVLLPSTENKTNEIKPTTESSVNNIDKIVKDLLNKPNVTVVDTNNNYTVFNFFRFSNCVFVKV